MAETQGMREMRCFLRDFCRYFACRFFILEIQKENETVR